MSSSDGRSRSTTVSVSVARACPTVDGTLCRARYKGCRLGDWRGCDNEIGKAHCQSSEGEYGRSGEAQPHHIERSSLLGNDMARALRGRICGAQSDRCGVRKVPVVSLAQDIGSG